MPIMLYLGLGMMLAICPVSIDDTGVVPFKMFLSNKNSKFPYFTLEGSLSQLRTVSTKTLGLQDTSLLWFLLFPS
jgi:hypothetical protein